MKNRNNRKNVFIVCKQNQTNVSQLIMYTHLFFIPPLYFFRHVIYLTYIIDIFCVGLPPKKAKSWHWQIFCLVF